MKRAEFASLVLATALAGCATSTTAGAPAGGSMRYGGGDGTSCAQAVVVHEKNEMAGIGAEYAWLRDRYPGYKRGAQSLIRCGGHRADTIQIRTADGRELEIVFDISEFFGAR